MSKRTHTYLSRAVLAALTLAMTANLGRAQDTATNEPAPPTVQWNDQAFNRLVDIDFVANAKLTLDPAELTDAAMMFKHAEDILVRPHRSGLTSGDLLKVATNAAGERGDKETLARLAKIADRDGNKELAAQVQIAQQLAGNARGPADTISFDASVDELIAKQNQLDKQAYAAASAGLPKDAIHALESLGVAATRGGSGGSPGGQGRGPGFTSNPGSPQIQRSVVGGNFCPPTRVTIFNRGPSGILVFDEEDGSTNFVPRGKYIDLEMSLPFEASLRVK